MDTRERMLRREFAETKLSLDKLKARADFEKNDSQTPQIIGTGTERRGGAVWDCAEEGVVGCVAWSILGSI